MLILHRLTGLLMAAAFVQLPLAGQPHCPVQPAGAGAHAMSVDAPRSATHEGMVMDAADASADECDSCAPAADPPCDHTVQGPCVSMASCAAVLAELTASVGIVPLQALAAVERLSGTLTALPVAPEPPPPRA